MKNFTLDRKTLEKHSKEYWDKGFTVIRSFVPKDIILKLKQESNNLYLDQVVDYNNIRTWFRKYPFNQKKLEKFEPICDYSNIFKLFSKQKELSDVVSFVLKSDIKILKNRLIFKQPQNIGYGLHQDFDFTWKKICVPNDILSVYIAIDSSNQENGALELFPYLHTKSIKHNKSTIDLNEIPSEVQNKKELVSTKEGDIILFHSLTPHRSSPNLSNLFRTVFYCIFCKSTCNLDYNTQLSIYIERCRKKRTKEEQKSLYFI